MPDRFAVRPTRGSAPINGVPISDRDAAEPPSPSSAEFALAFTGVGLRAGLSVGRAGAEKMSPGLRAGLSSTEPINDGRHTGSGAERAGAMSGSNLVRRSVAATAPPPNGHPASVAAKGVDPCDVRLDGRVPSTGHCCGGAPAPVSAQSRLEAELARVRAAAAEKAEATRASSSARPKREAASPSDGGAKALSRARSRTSNTATSSSKWDSLPHVDAASARPPDAEAGQANLGRPMPSCSTPTRMTAQAPSNSPLVHSS